MPLSRDAQSAEEEEKKERESVIRLEGLAHSFGMANFSVSVEARCFNHACYLHDNFVPFVPLFVALSAATPFAMDKLTEHDHDWFLKEKATGGDLEKPRFSIKRYISDHAYVHDFHNNND